MVGDGKAPISFARSVDIRLGKALLWVSQRLNNSMAQKLHGQALLDFVAANPNLGEKELVIGAGFCSEVTDKDGTPRVQPHAKAFFQELSIAQGIIKPSAVKGAAGRKPAGKSLSYELKSNLNTGNVVLTRGYLKLIGVQPGEYVSIEAIEEAGELVVKKSTTGFSDESYADGTVSAEEVETPSAALAYA